jgi:membrane protein DedA with SNARE-associated domain
VYYNSAVNDAFHFLARYGYWLLPVSVLGRQAFLPIPANLLLISAGALAHSGGLNLASAIGLSTLAFLVADLAWFETGRRLGNRILHFVCSFSGHAGARALTATSSFHRYDVKTLLVSKFIFGLDAVAVPLAGAGGVSRARFVLFDALGALLWSCSYATIGYVFSDQLERVAVHMQRIGFIGVLGVGVVLGFLLARRFVH